MTDTTITCSMTDCTREGKPEYITKDMELILCRPHVWDLFAHQAQKAREAMAEVSDQGLLLGPTKGFTYVLRMDDGTVKIGKGGTKGSPLTKRLTDLSNRSDENDGIPVHVLAVLPGGTSTELLAHHQWLHLRIPGCMERFYADPSLLAWAGEQGKAPEADQYLEKFQKWQEDKHLDPKRNGAREWAGKLGIKEGRLTGEFKTDPRQTEQTNEETEADNDDWEF